MVVNSYNNKESGFALVEAVLVLVVLAAIVGVGAYVVNQKHTAEATLSSNSGAQAKAPTGTTANVDQTTQQDAKTESAIDSSSDSSTQQNATSANGAISNIGGAYNEASY